MAKSFVDSGGVTKLRHKFSEISRLTETETTTTLEDIGRDLLTKSRAVTPKDTGDLRASGYYDITRGQEGPALEVGYTKEYAIYQHENLFENYTTPGTGPKYLENPFLENKGRYVEMLRDAARRPIRGR